MNPGIIFLTIVGWVTAVVLISLLLTFGLAAVAAMAKNARARPARKAKRSQSVIHSSPGGGSQNE